MDDFDPARSHGDRRPALALAAVVALFGAAVWLSYAHGAPAALPGAALGWDLLLHVERASVLLGTVGVVLLVGWRALQGEFPIRFGNVEYAAKSATVELDETSEDFDERISLLEDSFERHWGSRSEKGIQ
jgi:hypothetical protein